MHKTTKTTLTLDATECSGKLNPVEGQLCLPGVVHPEGRVKGNSFVSSAWTSYGLKVIDGGFAQRIIFPNRGGLPALPYNRQCEVGNE